MTSFSDPSRPVSGNRHRLGVSAWLVIGFLAACGIVVVLRGGEVADAAGTIGFSFGMAMSGVLFLVRARRLPRRERIGWSLVGLGILSALVGVIVVAGLFFVRGDAPAFGWHDLLFFTAYVLLIGGFASLPHTWGTPQQRLRTVLDGLIGAISVGALVWVFVLTDLIDVLERAPAWERIIGPIYPFFDIALVTVGFLVLLRRSTYRFDVRLLLVTIALIAHAVGDVSYLLSGLGASFAEARPLYPLNLLTVACFFLAAYLLDRSPAPREYAERSAPLWALLMPYGAGAGMVAALLWHDARIDENGGGRVLLLATLLVGLLVIIRQGVAIKENRQMVEQQRNSLVSSISHELRTPLTSIVGFVELLEQEGERLSASDRLEMTGIVHQQVVYMSRIVADLIMLARGNPSEIELEIGEVDVASLITSSIHASGVDPNSVHVECEAGLVGIFDADRLQQVMVNLLTNAARYGGPNRVLAAYAVRSDVVLEVHDDGPGIPRRYELAVWNRFERGPNRLNATIPGSGIGLAVVDAIARAHGGVAGYRRSELLGGACFTMTLPGRALHVSQSDADEGPDPRRLRVLSTPSESNA